MQTDKRYAPPEADVADIAVHETAPALWNPGAAASWSLLLSPVFGALLHMRNWQAMGEPGKAATSKTWAIGSLAFVVVSVLLSVVLPDSRALDALSRFGGIGVLIAWYYRIGKSQRAFVLARYGKRYPRKGWAKPLGLAVLAYIGFIAVVVCIVVNAHLPSLLVALTELLPP